MYNERKAAQMAAFLLGKTPEGRMSHLKLMKLLYLAERESMRLTGLPICWDHLVSMPHGPVLSMTLNLMDGDVESQPGGWEEWISDKAGHEVSLRRSFTPEDLDALSRAEEDILESVWQEFGGMGKWEIRDWTHQHCPEWTNPSGSSMPIPFHAMALAVGYSEAEASELAERIETEQNIDALYASL
ncbi:MAG: SocA family protein [Magnetococcales bacterium]|nr:SocA family protein [Magnetococcales bacterium]